MSIEKTFHTKSRLVRDLFMATVFICVGIVFFPTNIFGSNDQYMGLMAGLCVGFGLGFMARSTMAARETGRLVGTHIIETQGEV